MIQTILCSVNNQIFYITAIDEEALRTTAVSLTNAETPEVVFTAEDGNVTLISTTLSEGLTSTLQSFIAASLRPTIKQYLPGTLKPFLDINELCETEDVEFGIMYPNVGSLFSAATIQYCSEERLEEWERALKIQPSGTVEQRKMYMLATLRGQGKLTESKISNIVNAFTGGDAITTLVDSNLVVKVLPPNNGEIFLFPDVERALSALIPAHLGLSVIRFYSTWDDIKTSFATWNDVAALPDWDAVKNYIQN